MPGIIGSMQALEAIKLIASVGEPLIGRLLLFDGLSMKWRELRLKKNRDCVMCGDTPTIHALIDYDEFCGNMGKDMTGNDSTSTAEITVADLKRRLDNGERPFLLDVR